MSTVLQTSLLPRTLLMVQLLLRSTKILYGLLLSMKQKILYINELLMVMETYHQQLSAIIIPSAPGQAFLLVVFQSVQQMNLRMYYQRKKYSFIRKVLFIIFLFKRHQQIMNFVRFQLLQRITACHILDISSHSACLKLCLVYLDVVKVFIDFI